MYEKSAPTAFTVMFSLLMSPKDEIKFNAAKEILNKVLPEKMNDNFAFLMKKSEEELVALISGSGAFEQLRGLISATSQGQVESDVEAGTDSISTPDNAAEGVQANP